MLNFQIMQASFVSGRTVEDARGGKPWGEGKYRDKFICFDGLAFL